MNGHYMGINLQVSLCVSSVWFTRVLLITYYLITLDLIT